MASQVEERLRKIITRVIKASAVIARGFKNPSREHLFLSGIHAPMTEELLLEELPVTGEIPSTLTGTYARIGPNPYKVDPRGHHWFVGDGMVHGIRISNGKPQWYRNRFIKSRALERQGGPKAASGPRRGGRDTVNTNVLKLAGKTLALVESGPFPFELDERLDTKESAHFDGGLRAPFSAHPHEDHRTGEWHAITYEPESPNRVWHIAISPDGHVLSERKIPVSDGPSIHECGITDDYVIVFDLPVTFSLAAVAQGFNFPYRWNKEHTAQVGLLPRRGEVDDIIWCDVDPCYLFHVANTFQNSDGSVTIDCCAYETMFAHGPDGPNGAPCGFERWHVDPVKKQVIRTTTDLAPQEFPRIDERFFGQPYKHAWVVSQPGETVSNFVAENTLFHYDMETGRKKIHHFGKGMVGGEFIFVPQSADAEEARGWLMGLVIDIENDNTQLQFFDALAIERGPRGVIHLPHRVPPGFHGNWIPD